MSKASLLREVAYESALEYDGRSFLLNNFIYNLIYIPTYSFKIISYLYVGKTNNSQIVIL